MVTYEVKEIEEIIAHEERDIEKNHNEQLDEFLWMVAKIIAEDLLAEEKALSKG